MAAIFRLLKEALSTLLFDEVDAIFSPKAAKEHEDLRALINAGYRRGATVARLVGIGTKMSVTRFPVFAATALAAIGDLPDTIESRAIIVPMRRRAPDEPVAQFRRRLIEDETENLRGSLAEWAAVYEDQLAQSRPPMPDILTDRAADIWEPLLAIADLAGGDWPKRARDAAVAVVSSRVADDHSTGVRLLADLKVVMGSQDRMPTAEILSKLNALDESGWGGWNDGKGMSPRDLARKLKLYGVEAKTVRLENLTPRCYLLADFLDPFARYLRDESETSATKQNTDSSSQRGFVADVLDVLDIDGNGNKGSRDQDSSLPCETSKTVQHQIRNPLHTVADVADSGLFDEFTDALDSLTDADYPVDLAELEAEMVGA